MNDLQQILLPVCSIIATLVANLDFHNYQGVYGRIIALSVFLDACHR